MQGNGLQSLGRFSLLLRVFPLGDSPQSTGAPSPPGPREEPGKPRGAPFLTFLRVPSLQVPLPRPLLPAFHCFAILIVPSCDTSTQVQLPVF